MKSKAKLDFKAEDKTLKDVLFADRKFRVPRYQRPYAWSSAEISEFWDDLITSEEPYFLGSLIFNRETENESGYNDIIDGQQRLLTVTIFISVLRDIAKKLDRETAKRYQRQDIAVEDRDGSESFRILPSDSLKDYFIKFIQNAENNVISSNPETKEQNLVKSNYQFLYEKVEDELKRFDNRDLKIEKLDNLRDRVAKLIIIDIEISKEEDAYEIFETTNARGVDLSVSDLLKNMIFKKIPAKDDRDLAKEIWENITTNIEATNTEMKKFIRYFWISRFSFVTEKKVYREIKKNISDWEALLNDIWDDASKFNLLLEGEESDFQEIKHGVRIYNSIYSLRLMRVTQCWVLLLSILRNFDKLKTDPTYIFEFIEKFTFQYSVVCKLPGNKVERIYSKYAIEIENAINDVPEKRISGAIQSIFSKLITTLKTEAPTEMVFYESFNDLCYRNSEKSRMLIKYILSKINYFLSKTNELKIDFSSVNVEHILPKNPSKEWNLSKKDIKDYVNLLGNLTLLSIKINSKIQNGPISKKIIELKKSELPMTQEIVNELIEKDLKWKEENVRDRQRWFASIAFNEIWKL